MTALLPAPPTRVRWLTESRPPALVLRRAALLTVPTTPAQLPLGPPGASPLRTVREGRAVVVRAPWTSRPDPALPDAAGWSASLAVAVVEALLAHRPVAQLNRWLRDDVLASVTLHQRLRRTSATTTARPRLVSVRVQHPAARAAEAAAFLSVGRRPLALALRLEALGDRWLCTALELGPRPQPDTYG